MGAGTDKVAVQATKVAKAKTKTTKPTKKPAKKAAKATTTGDGCGKDVG